MKIKGLESRLNIGIVGSRNFHNYDYLKKYITSFLKSENIEEDIVVVSGGAKGADTLGEKLADEFNYNKIIHLPEWSLYGRKAGFLRNQYIVRDSDIIFAFWDGISKGTKSTIHLAKKENKRVEIIFI